MTTPSEQTTDPPASERGVLRRGLSLVTTVNEWWQATRPGRALGHFNRISGSLLCGGIAYSALFSIFAALTLVYSTLALVLKGRPEALQTVLDAINDAVPGLIDTGNGGALTPDQLLIASGRSWTNVVAVAVLLWSAISFMGGMRSAMRAVLGLAAVSENFFVAKARELGGFVVVVVGVVLSAGLSVLAARFGSWVADAMDLPDASAVLVTLVGLLLAGIVDVGVVVYVIAVLSGARPRVRDLLWGSAAAAVVLGGVRYLGTSVVAGAASKNVLLASFAVIVTLLVLVNFVARVLLMVAAWVADPPQRS